METEYQELNWEERARNMHLADYLKLERPSGRCVYVGLGTGVNIPTLLTYFDHITIIEPDGELIDRFVRVNPIGSKLTFIQQRFEDVIIDAPVDCIFLIAVIEHISDIEAALVSLDRIAKPSADVYLMLNNPRSLHRQFGVATGHIGNCFEITEAEGPRGHGHYYLYDVGDVLKLLSKVRFTHIKLAGFCVKPLPTFLMNGLATDVISGFMKSFVHLSSDQHAYTFAHVRRI